MANQWLCSGRGSWPSWPWSSSSGAYIAIGRGFAAALRWCAVLCLLVWLSLVLVALALSPWGVRPGSLPPWGGALRGVGTLPASFRVPLRAASALPAWGPCCRAFPGGGVDQGRGPRHQGYLRVPPGARSSVLPFLGFGQSAVYPGVPSGAAWVRYLVRPGRLRRRRARERWQA